MYYSESFESHQEADGKERIFSKEEGLDRATEILQLIGNKARLSILCELLQEDELPVYKILERVNLSQSALSQHLAKLRILGLVETRRDHQWIYYSLNREDIKKILIMLHDLYCPDDEN